MGSVPWPSRAMVPFLALKGDLNDKFTSLKWCFRFRLFKCVFYIWCTYTLHYDLSLGICYTDRFIIRFMANKEVKTNILALFFLLKILDSLMQFPQKKNQKSCNSKAHLSHLILRSFVWFCCCLYFGFFSSEIYKKLGEKRKFSFKNFT